MISKGPIQPLCCDYEKIPFCFKDTKIDKVNRVVLVIVKIKGEASLLVVLFPPSLGGKMEISVPNSPGVFFIERTFKSQYFSIY